ncbi:glycosyltransferase [Mycolicibacterium sp. S2-37]|uniref:glycosyltransferase n=1 Tax=Mycolicibacterium sp. S2-37 TaxID=2810297 RepID=UPI001A950CE9|nr:glycosyltransferase [Mycolicibacterium sp. S2-37]MBO0675910.1 glycosyltransferase [Mycolicibacterium sp. S2-37]
MRVVLAFYGTRGDVEPGIAVGLELSNRGHDVCMAIPPDLIASVEAVGLTGVGYGPATQAWLEDTRDFWAYLFRNFWRVRDVRNFLRKSREPGIQAWAEMSATLVSVTDGADVLISGMSYQELAVDVAEHLDVPFATVLWFPIRVNGHLVPTLPAPLVRKAMTAYEWLVWLGVRKVENDQRRELGLSPAKGPAPGRIAERGSLEIQAYDDVCFPGLAAEWANGNGRRPFVGNLTLGAATDADEDVVSWIEAGRAPICFGFGSIPVESPAEMIEMIAVSCAQLGERALVCAGWTDFSKAREFDHVKVVGAMNYAKIFPSCRAVVHHGGAGTTAASLRAGVPTLILWMADVQVVWGVAIKRLGVGACRRFSATTQRSLVADLRTILTPECGERARELAVRMSAPTTSVRVAADLVEEYVQRRPKARRHRHPHDR